MINILCDHALLTGYARNTHAIDADIVKECAKELRIPIKSGMKGVKGVVATVQTPGSRSIAEAASRQRVAAAEPPAMQRPQAAGVAEGANATPESEDGRGGSSPLLKILYAFIVLILVALGGYAITQFGSEERPKYGAEDLTPKKYKSSLEKEKARLSKHLEDGGGVVEDEDGKDGAEKLPPTSSEPGVTPGDRQQSKAHHAVTTPPKIEVGDRDPADKRQGRERFRHCRLSTRRS